MTIGKKRWAIAEGYIPPDDQNKPRRFFGGLQFLLQLDGALGIVINVVFNQWDFIGGSSGLKDIPGFTLGAYVFDQRAYAILAWALVAIGIWFASANSNSFVRLVRSHSRHGAMILMSGFSE